MRKFILFLAITAFSVNLFAQQECAFILEEAQELFDAGLIESVPDKLSECLESGFTNEEKLQAYKLIILSYIFDDNIEKADEYMMAFLSDYPAYEPVATDPREFVLLMETYNTDPVLMLGGGVGANLSFPILTEPFGVHNVVDHQARMVPGRAGFHGNFMVERKLLPQLNLMGELSVASILYDSYLEDESEVIVTGAEVTDYSLIEYYETQTQLRVPVSASYEFMTGDFKPYVRVGIVPGILLKANGEGTRIYVNTEKILYDDITLANINVLPGRRVINVWAFAGAGFNYKLGPGNFFLELRYHMNLLNQVKPGSDPYQFQALTSTLFYVNDKFLLNNVSATMGYMFPLYRPKKKEE